MPILCRDCLASAPARQPTGFCAVCGSARMVVHEELDDLSIAHLDCDAFYASIEIRDDPALLGKPVLVGGRHRGVVAACSYEARRFGIHSAMPMFQALKRCPEAVVIAPDMKKYAAVGRDVRRLMGELTPLVEPLSIDEAFLDLAGTEKIHGGSAAHSLAALVLRIRTALGITVSIGLSYDKLLAKVDSTRSPTGKFCRSAQKGARRPLAKARTAPRGVIRHLLRVFVPARARTVEPVRRLDLGRDRVEHECELIAEQANGDDNRNGDTGRNQAILDSRGAGLILQRLELLDGRFKELQHNTLLNRLG